jgi:glycosyltransferase involved in cell wall biosynthesis
MTDTPPVRVLHLCPDTQYLRQLFSLYRTALDEPPFESTTVFLRGRPDADLGRALGGRAVFLDLSRSQLEGLRLPALWRLWRWSRSQPRFDLVVAHRFKPLKLALVLHRLGIARHVFGVVHDLGQFDRQRRRRQLERAAAAPLTLIGVSEAVRADLLQHLSAFPVERVKLLVNAVDAPPALDRVQALAALNLAPQRFWFGSVGRLVPRKGHDVLLRAFAPLAHAAADVGLAIIGSGQEEARLRSLCRELGIDDRVVFCGWRTDARALLTAFDVCVFPSRKEPFGLVNAEAMAAGCPVIASAVDGVPEVVGDQALLVPADDVDALADALRRLHGDALLRQTMGVALRQRWQALFSPPIFAQRLRAYARDVMGAPS